MPWRHGLPWRRMRCRKAPKDSALLPVGPGTTLTKNVGVSGAGHRAVQRSPSAANRPYSLPGWVWNLERRQQWRTALDHWRRHHKTWSCSSSLPPACQPNPSCLLSHLPQVIWLAGSGIPEMEETRAQLETLRHARCNLSMRSEIVNRRHRCGGTFQNGLKRFSGLLLGSVMGGRS